MPIIPKFKKGDKFTLGSIVSIDVTDNGDVQYFMTKDGKTGTWVQEKDLAKETGKSAKKNDGQRRPSTDGRRNSGSRQDPNQKNKTPAGRNVKAKKAAKKKSR